jgi:hypothetical protein
MIRRQVQATHVQTRFSVGLADRVTGIQHTRGIALNAREMSGWWTSARAERKAQQASAFHNLTQHCNVSLLNLQRGGYQTPGSMTTDVVSLIQGRHYPRYVRS